MSDLVNLCNSLDWCRHNNATLKLGINRTVLVVNEKSYISETIEECVSIAIAGEFRRTNGPDKCPDRSPDRSLKPEDIKEQGP